MTKIPLPRRRWFVGTSVDHPGRPDWRIRVKQRSLWPCWTYKGALRKAQRWNTLRKIAWPREPELFEVFGPLGKEESDAT